MHDNPLISAPSRPMINPMARLSSFGRRADGVAAHPWLAASATAARTTRAVLAILAILAMLALTGCATSPTPGPTAAVDPVVAVGQSNVELLSPTDEFTTTEMIDTATGEIATLADIATGDRALMLWYWSPD